MMGFGGKPYSFGSSGGTTGGGSFGNGGCGGLGSGYSLMSEGGAKRFGMGLGLR